MGEGNRRPVRFVPNPAPLPLGEGGRRPGEGAAIALTSPDSPAPPRLFLAVCDGLLALGTLTPTLSQRERGSEGCDTNLPDMHRNTPRYASQYESATLVSCPANSCDKLRRIFCCRQGAMTCRGGFQTRPSGVHHARKSNAADGKKDQQIIAGICGTPH